jgi:hypothetical protein
MLEEAEEARQMAIKASNEVARQFWLRTAQGYTDLAVGANPPRAKAR